MIYKIGECINNKCNEFEKCLKRIQIATCTKSGKTENYETGQNFANNVHGITAKVKRTIEDLVYNCESRPKK